jgi:hypothetical protein
MLRGRETVRAQSTILYKNNPKVPLLLSITAPGAQIRSSHAMAFKAQ